jgi:competence protein ComEA
LLALTPSERRGATVVVLLLAIGAGHDLWRARHPRLAPPPESWPPAALEESVSRGAGAHGSSRDGSQPDTIRSNDKGPIVDLNRASISELDALPGIGPVLAGRIVEHRAAHGPFGSLDELLAVRGIGPRLLERLKSRVRVGPGETRSIGG